MGGGERIGDGVLKKTAVAAEKNRREAVRAEPSGAPIAGAVKIDVRA